MQIYEAAKRASKVGLWINISLTIIKILIGILAKSQALVADGIHSGSDILATAVVYLSLFYAYKPKDKDHPYGHGKIESLAAIFVSLILFGIVIFLFYDVGHSFYDNLILKKTVNSPSWFALIGAIISIIVKEWLFRYTYRIGKKIDSPAVIANAWDHRSDAYSSIGVLAGITGAVFGFGLLDPIAAFVVGIFIVVVAIKILKEACNDLLDKAIPEKISNEIREYLLNEEGIYEVNYLNGRKMGSFYILDIGIDFLSFYSLNDVHEIIHRIEENLLRKFNFIAGVNLHVHAVKNDEELKKRSLIISDIINSNIDKKKIIDFHDLDYRLSSESEIINLHLTFQENISLSEAHDITSVIENKIKMVFPNASISIHMEPKN